MFLTFFIFCFIAIDCHAAAQTLPCDKMQSMIVDLRVKEEFLCVESLFKTLESGVTQPCIFIGDSYAFTPDDIGIRPDSFAKFVTVENMAANPFFYGRTYDDVSCQNLAPIVGQI